MITIRKELLIGNELPPTFGGASGRGAEDLLEKLGIIWSRPNPLTWIDDDGIDHRYYPDFLIGHLYIDTKNDYLAIKDARKIELVKNPPLSSWSKSGPGEYGFYANVNPEVPHPRWSQSSERVLGAGFFTPRRKTELFNGYAEEVASLYSDMDLRHFF